MLQSEKFKIGNHRSDTCEVRKEEDNNNDDADDVKAAAYQYYVALNAGDADAYGQLNAAESSIFAAGGGLLSRHLSLEARKQSFQATVEGGLKRHYNQPSMPR